MAIHERINILFADCRVSDIHVNVGHKVGDKYIDGDLERERVFRQFDAKTLQGEPLRHIGLRTHYSAVEIPEGASDKFIPSVTLNWVGIDPPRVEAELNRFSHSHPIIWFQSFRDPYHRQSVDAGYKKAIASEGEESIQISHTDEFGRLTTKTLEVLEIARDKSAIIATPHSNFERTLPLITTAVSMGLSVLWVHPDSRLIRTPLAIQEALSRLGPGRVFIERAAVFLRDGKRGSYSTTQIVSDVRAVGKDHIIFTSDLGRLNEKDPLLPSEGLHWYIEQLLEAGLTIEEAELGLVVNPQRLLEGDR